MIKLKTILMTALWAVLAQCICAQSIPTADLYGTGSWDADSLGNHRAVVTVEGKADAVVADLKWRRRDPNPEERGVIVVDAATGERLTNVVQMEVSRESGKVIFQPKTAPGTYYIYYLKSVSTGSRYYPTVNYIEPQRTASDEWLKRNALTGKKAPKLAEARLVQYQAIDAFHSFYPMEVTATAAECKAAADADPSGKFILFTEDRRYPIRMTTDIPYRWAAGGRHDCFEGTADKGEWYAFQVGVWAARGDVERLRVSCSDLKNETTGEVIPSSAFSCINTGGTDVTGELFEKDCSVEKGRVQALWMGVMMPETASEGVYSGVVTIDPANDAAKTVELRITLTDRVIADHGDNEPWRHSRLRWLNSQIGHDDGLVAPYTAVALEGRTLSILGREVTLTDNGLPAGVKSFFSETLTETTPNGRDLLASPLALQADGGEWECLDFSFTKRREGAVAWKSLSRNDLFLMELEGKLEADGCMEYRVTLVAQEDAQVDDIALRTALAPGVGKYMMGLGEKGGLMPADFSWKWDVEKNQDAVWVGDVNAGVQLRLYDDSYERPLNTNFYHQKPLRMPASWDNGGKGGISVKGSVVTAYSGPRSVSRGDRLQYWFTLLLTPFRTIDTDRQWHDRYYHGYQFIDDTERFGATVVNVHHATAVNPFINYPFLRTEEMKSYIDGAHARGMKVKIYNTVRELSNSCAELFALRSLGGEIFSAGKGGGYSWLQEHLDQDYIAAWFAANVKDAAIVNTGVSRWHNYYMEGLDWLTRHVGIDGVYIDDLAFDRMSMKRVRKILSRNNPGALIDLHSANQFNPADGFANSANLYLEHFPYIDRLWFGEYFDYDMPPEQWLVEVSGIPYGLMGEMLEGGGNKWRGMVYGMTGRDPGYGVDNRPLWRFWDDFGMKGSRMIGYWVSDCPVKTGSGLTPATVYIHASGRKALIAVATWEDADAEVTLSIDWDKLGIDPKTARLHAPAIDGYQQEMSWAAGDKITIPKGQGFLIIAE